MVPGGAGGRYTQADPRDAKGLENPYGYAFESPIVSSDPYGLSPGVSGDRVRMCCKRLLLPDLVGEYEHCYFQMETFGRRRTLGLHGTQTIRGYWDAVTGRDVAFVNWDNSFDTNDIDYPPVCGPWKPCSSCVARTGSNYPNPSWYAASGPNSNTFASFVGGQCGITPPPLSTADRPGWGMQPAAPALPPPPRPLFRYLSGGRY